MKKKFLSLCILCLFCTMLLAGCKNKEQEQTHDHAHEHTGEYLSGTHYAQIDVANYGSIILELNADAAPATVTNFVNLVQNGFYDGLTFHRIINGFMMQGGDPEGTGLGGSEHTVHGEFSLNGHENPISHVRGTISMARTANDYNSASSQFFIVHQDATTLDGSYAAFGKVLYGMDIVDKICATAVVTDDNGTVASESRPVISSANIITKETIEVIEEQAFANLPDPTANLTIVEVPSTEGFIIKDSWNIDEDGQTFILFSSADLTNIGVYKTDLTSGLLYDASSLLASSSDIKANECIAIKLNLTKEDLPTLLLVAEEPSGAIGQYLFSYDEFYGGAYLVPVIQ